MSEHILALIDKEIDRLSVQIDNLNDHRITLSREREKLLRIAKKSDAPAARAAKPKTAPRKAGGMTVKDQILSFLLARGGSAKTAQIIEATGAKSTTINGTLHQLKKAGHVSLTIEGWTAVAGAAASPNGGNEARA